jgi:hypothetical protein
VGALVFLSWLVRICLALLVVRLVLRFVAGLVRGLRGEPGPGRPRARPGPAIDLVRDPVCGTFVPREGALRGRLEGQEAFFCSPACRDRAGRGAGSRPGLLE